MPPDRVNRICAFGVHLLTASGAGFALLALIAVSRGNAVAMFWWLGLALFVDGIDGTLARRFQVAERLPRWSGEVLDFVVDFTTYVFVPAYAITASGLLPEALAAPLGILIVVTSAIYFADREMKTADNYFRGFPALWNAATFYLYLWKPSPSVAAFAMIALAAMTFLPVRFIHPLRVASLRTVSLLALILWAILAMAALFRNLDPGLGIAVALTGLGLYFMAGGFLRARA